jgi:hypothetical protein
MDPLLKEYGALDHVPAPTKKSKKRNRQSKPEFIKGPIPLHWLSQAAALSGKALAVGLALWFRSGIEKRRSVKLHPSTLTKLGVSRWSMYRALDALEAAGLVRVQRHRGRSPTVTVLDEKNQG